jgi:hypothetical protein
MAAAMAMAVRSLPPRPRVVISPLGGLALEAGEHDDVAFIEHLFHRIGRDVHDAGLGVHAVGGNAGLRTGEGHRLAAEGIDGHRGEGDGGLLAGGEEHVHLTLDGITLGRRLPWPV